MAVINLSRSLGHGLTPDLTKRKRGKPSGHTVATYNATPMGIDHPKGPDGRFVDGHPSVGMLGDMPDFVHSLSDADLARADEQVNSLVAALTAEKGRRGSEAFAAAVAADKAKKTNPAKPLRAKAPTKPIDPALAERVEAMKKRPIPSDRAYLEEQLPKLTVAQLGELGRFGDWADLPPVGKTKADKVQDVIRRLTNRLSSEAVTHQSSAKGREHYDEYRRRLAAAEARGDRDEYAALVAGFGTGGTGPGLPPEKVPPKQNFSVASDPWAGFAEKAEALRNPAKPLRASGSKHIDNPPEAGESAITKPAAKGVGRISAKDLPEAMAEIDALAANPKTERDRDRVKYLLGRMTLAQIKQVADKHHNGLLIGANKDEKVRRLADTIVGTKLDAAGIAGGIQSGAHATRVAALRAATDRETARGWLTGLKLADLKEVADELGMPGGAARPASKGALGEAIVEFTAGNKANSRAIRGGVLDPPAEGSLAARQEQRRLRMTEQPPDELGDLRRQLANVEAAEVSEIDSRRATGMRGEARELRRQIARIESGADEGTVDQPREKTRAEIMAVYSQLVSRPGEILSLVKLRGNLPHIKHDELTEVLKQMDRERLIHLDPDPNTKAIPKSGHDAAIRLGGEDKHFISIS